MSVHALPLPTGLSAGQPAVAADDSDLIVRRGWIVVVLFFGVFLGWAGFVRLDAAAQGTGAISVAGSRQVVQHREGGVVRALHVREGQRVRAGDVLIELAADETLAAERSLAAQTIRLEAERARLLAERDGGDVVTPPSFALLDAGDRPAAAAAMVQARAELATRRAALVDQKHVIAQQTAQLQAEIGGIGERIALNAG